MVMLIIMNAIYLLNDCVAFFLFDESRALSYNPHNNGKSS